MSWFWALCVRFSGMPSIIDFAYDALNRRIQEIRPSETRDLFYSAEWQLLEEQINAVAVAHYVWSPVYVDALVLRDGADSGDPQPVLYALQDANFNVTAIVDTSGSVVERYVYDPYGAVTYLTGNWGSRSASLYGWVYNHQGLRFVLDVGLYYNRNRDYSPTLMRLVQQDPIQFAGGDVNFYRYVSNSPNRLSDPLGLACCRISLREFMQLDIQEIEQALDALKGQPPKLWPKVLPKLRQRIGALIEKLRVGTERTFLTFLKYLASPAKAIELCAGSEIDANGCCKITKLEPARLVGGGPNEFNVGPDIIPGLPRGGVRVVQSVEMRGDQIVRGTKGKDDTVTTRVLLTIGVTFAAFEINDIPIEVDRRFVIPCRHDQEKCEFKPLAELGPPVP